MEVRIAVAADPSPRVDAAIAAAFAEIARLEAILSDWRVHSEVNRLAERPGEWTPASPELVAVLSLALAVADATDGAFDPTIGRLTLLWRAQRDTGREPTEAERHSALATVGWRAVAIDTIGRRVRLPANGVRLDLGGIAKGWILDRARDTLLGRGFDAVLLEAGGDLLLGAPPPGTPGWRVAITTSRGDSLAWLRNVAIATSGPAVQSLRDADGRRRSHVIDPRDGRGLAGALQVTVAADRGAVADGLATALTLVQRERWSRLQEQFRIRWIAFAEGGS
jgi:thiamine biosynthesis lipoprotein